MMRLLLGGDVMTGRGIDQILAHPVAPALGESSVSDARDYVTLAEAACGPVPRRVAPEYVWGDALAVVDERRPDARIVNLETSVTTSDDAWPGKSVHYRMSPANAGCLRAASLDVCALANNHVLDYGRPGLGETVATLDALGIAHAGAGRDRRAAEEPAVVELGGGRRVLVFGVGGADSGIPRAWAATNVRSGVAWLEAPSDAAADRILAHVREKRAQRDVVVVSIHQGGNWGYDVDAATAAFAHRLVDGGVDVVHGHSSHHARPIEIRRDRLVLFGCGDLIDDYEGIEGYEDFRGDIALLYFADLDDDGRLVRLEMVPLREERMRLARASDADVECIAHTLDEVSAPFGTRIARTEAGALAVVRP